MYSLVWSCAVIGGNAYVCSLVCAAGINLHKNELWTMSETRIRPVGTVLHDILCVPWAQNRVGEERVEKCATSVFSHQGCFLIWSVLCVRDVQLLFPCYFKPEKGLFHNLCLVDACADLGIALFSPNARAYYNKEQITNKRGIILVFFQITYHVCGELHVNRFWTWCIPSVMIQHRESPGCTFNPCMNCHVLLEPHLLLMA